MPSVLWYNLQLPYLLDCKPQLIKLCFYHFVRLIMEGGLHFLFLYFSDSYRWPPSFLGYVSSTKPSFFAFYSLQHHVHTSSHEDCDEQKAVVVVKASLPGLPTNAKRVSAWKYHRGVGNLCSSAAYINFFNTVSCRYDQGRLTTG